MQSSNVLNLGFMKMIFHPVLLFIQDFTGIFQYGLDLC